MAKHIKNNPYKQTVSSLYEPIKRAKDQAPESIVPESINNESTEELLNNQVTEETPVPTKKPRKSRRKKVKEPTQEKTKNEGEENEGSEVQEAESESEATDPSA